MSEFKITGENGKTTTFTFKFDNGLPTKPIINPAYDIGYNEEEKYYALSMYLTEDDLKQLGNLEVEDLNYSEELHEIWLTINDKYVVFNEISDKIINELSNKKLVFCFFKEDNTFIYGLKIE